MIDLSHVTKTSHLDRTIDRSSQQLYIEGNEWVVWHRTIGELRWWWQVAIFFWVVGGGDDELR